LDKDGAEQLDAKLSQTAYVPGTPFNLISVGDKVKGGWKVIFDDDQARLWKGETTIVFDVVVNTPKGRLFGGFLNSGNVTVTLVILLLLVKLIFSN
jgi:hypothetical protein